MSTVATTLIAEAKARALQQGKVLCYERAPRAVLNVTELRQAFFDHLHTLDDLTLSQRLNRLRRLLRWVNGDEMEDFVWRLLEPLRSETNAHLDWMMDNLKEIIEEAKGLLAEERRAEREEAAVDSIASRLPRPWRVGSAHRPGGIVYHVPPTDSHLVLGYYLGMPYHSMEELQAYLNQYNPEPDAPVGLRTAVYDWQVPDMWEPEEPLVDPSPWGWGSLSSGERPYSNSISEYDLPSTSVPRLR